MSRLGIEASFDFILVNCILSKLLCTNDELRTLPSEDWCWLIGLFVTTKLVFNIPHDGMMGEENL